MHTIFTILLLIVLSSHLTQAADKIVSCEIMRDGATAYTGKCILMPLHDGSFILSNLQQQIPLFDDVSMVSVSLTEKDVADVRGLTSAGIRSLWGEAKRFQKDPACCTGYDFEICVR